CHTRARAAVPGQDQKKDLPSLHRRFARAALVLYLAAAGVGAALLLGMLVSDLSYQKASARAQLRFDAETRAHWLGRELALLAGELRRLGLRSEVNLLDENMAPEQSLFRLSHEKSAFFNVGVAIVGRDGSV